MYSETFFVIKFAWFFKQILKKQLANSYFQIKNVNDEKWNTDLSIEKQVEPLPNDKEWEYPRNKLTLGNISKKLTMLKICAMKNNDHVQCSIIFSNSYIYYFILR